MAAKGYPGAYNKGAVIKGLDKVSSKVYHMGTAKQGSDIVTNGGRVMIVVGQGESLKAAREAAMADIAKIECDDLFYRSDIGHQAIK